ncbi:unknown protein [Seminavis robusta]|uniref:Uncharacterized protein n=1 Tax=Seminavis robusta TaxID=568900 RepID=A0A9N8HWP0_9STRA|nr:unknown protein [Seminavis robusta]|eukprot:Sro1677_g290570.1 n/a (217) ;mRNA; r:11796-12446
MEKQKRKADASSIKDAGNKLFARGEFEAASKFYAKGLKIVEAQLLKDNDVDCVGDVQPETVYLKAVFLSNLSNCRFEVGSYTKSVTFAQSCLTVLKELEGTSSELQVKSRALYCKNVLRMARAHFYGHKIEDSITMLEELSTCENEAYSKRGKKMLKQFSQYISQNKCPPTPEALLKQPVRLLRVALMEPIVEYYRFGHNEVQSALDEGPMAKKIL